MRISLLPILLDSLNYSILSIWYIFVIILCNQHLTSNFRYAVSWWRTRWGCITHMFWKVRPWNYWINQIRVWKWL